MEKEAKENNNEINDIIIEKLPKNCSVYDKSIKIILLGDSGVGKTSLLNCLEPNDIDLNQKKTISLEYFNYIIKANNNIIRMQIWDTVGHEKFNSIISNYYKTTDVAIFMYSIDNIESFNNINNWFNELNDKGNNDNNIKTIKILLGNKNDLEKERKVTYEMGEKLKNEKNFYFFQEINCSYKNKEENDLVQNLFFEIGKIVYKEYIFTKMERVNSSVYNYEASNSILATSDSQTNTTNKKHKSCFC
jgi:small GTP-binding protein